MTVITRISKTKQGRFALFSEEGFLFSVDGETLLKHNVSEDTALCDEALCALRAASDTRKAKDKALTYLSLRDYASRELYDKLCLRFDGETAAAAVAEMCRLALINDAAFAVHRAKYLAGQKKSKREIARVLQQKGIAREDIAAALDALSCEDCDALNALIEKQYAAKLAAGGRDKVIAALMRRGFAYCDIKRAIAPFLCDDDMNFNDTGECE